MKSNLFKYRRLDKEYLCTLLSKYVCYNFIINQCLVDSKMNVNPIIHSNVSIMNSISLFSS